MQLAKSAIRTGVKLLAAEAGLDETRIARFVIAGAFGAYIGVEAAWAIGLLPDLPRERLHPGGQCRRPGRATDAGLAHAPPHAARWPSECRYVELSSRGDFQKTFLQHIGF